jgi:hypothetical protein
MSPPSVDREHNRRSEDRNAEKECICTDDITKTDVPRVSQAALGNTWQLYFTIFSFPSTFNGV